MLASIQKIHSIQPHFNPEVNRLELGKVMEWPVVIPKGEFKDNQLVVFIEIDSIVPESNPYFKFMERQKYRVWNARFKGAPSSGLVCPLSILPSEFLKSLEVLKIDVNSLEEGYDLTEFLGIRKYERAIDGSTCGDAAGSFPTSLISISDEDNLLSHAKALSELDDKNIYLSQKVDGSSTTFIFNNNEFKAYSRRLEMKRDSGFPWQAVKKYDIENKLIKLNRNLAIQAEAIGPKLNGNNLGLKELEIKVFRIKDLDTKQIYGLKDLVDLCNYLELPHVDIIDNFVFDKNIHTVEYFRNIADTQKWKTNNEAAEGIVIAPIFPFYSYILQKSWSLKIINQNYK